MQFFSSPPKKEKQKNCKKKKKKERNFEIEHNLGKLHAYLIIPSTFVRDSYNCVNENVFCVVFCVHSQKNLLLVNKATVSAEPPC